VSVNHVRLNEQFVSSVVVGGVVGNSRHLEDEMKGTEQWQLSVCECAYEYAHVCACVGVHLCVHVYVRVHECVCVCVCM
jgi:hypothetical protein